MTFHLGAKTELTLSYWVIMSKYWDPQSDWFPFGPVPNNLKSASPQKTNRHPPAKSKALPFSVKKKRVHFLGSPPFLSRLAASDVVHRATATAVGSECTPKPKPRSGSNFWAWRLLSLRTKTSLLAKVGHGARVDYFLRSLARNTCQVFHGRVRATLVAHAGRYSAKGPPTTRQGSLQTTQKETQPTKCAQKCTWRPTHQCDD